jgi:hypothetical protein
MIGRLSFLHLLDRLTFELVRCIRSFVCCRSLALFDYCLYNSDCLSRIGIDRVPDGSFVLDFASIWLQVDCSLQRFPVVSWFLMYQHLLFSNPCFTGELSSFGESPFTLRVSSLFGVHWRRASIAIQGREHAVQQSHMTSLVEPISPGEAVAGQ